jgi:trehalose 6-phosphate synthase
MKEAVLVNPYSAEEMSDAIVQALAMPKEERIRRWRTLMDGVEKHDVLWWRRCFTHSLMGEGQALEAETADQE